MLSLTLVPRFYVLRMIVKLAYCREGTRDKVNCVARPSSREPPHKDRDEDRLKQTDRQIDRQTDRQTDRKRDTNGDKTAHR